MEVVLGGLFADHGAPLVIKFKNGSALQARRVSLLELGYLMIRGGPI